MLVSQASDKCPKACDGEQGPAAPGEKREALTDPPSSPVVTMWLGSTDLMWAAMSVYHSVTASGPQYLQRG